MSRNLQAISTKMGVDHRVSATLHALTLARRVHAAAISAQGGAVHLGVTTRKKPPVD